MQVGTGSRSYSFETSLFSAGGGSEDEDRSGLKKGSTFERVNNRVRRSDSRSQQQARASHAACTRITQSNVGASSLSVRMVPGDRPRDQRTKNYAIGKR